jgi:hypothetical protein
LDDEKLDLIAETFEDIVRINSPAQIYESGHTGVFFIAGTALETIDNQRLREYVTDTQSFLVVVPPMNGFDPGALTLDSQVEIAPDPHSTKVIPQRSLQRYVPLEEFSVVSNGTIQGDGGVVLATNDELKPLLRSFQSTSTEGGVIFTSIELASYQLQSNETHRQDLLHGIVEYISHLRIGRSDQSDGEDEETPQIVLPDKVLNNALLALYTLQKTGITRDELSRGVVQETLPESLSFDPSEQEWAALLEYIDESEIFEDGRLRGDVLSEAITNRRLEPYVRRLDG